MNKLKNIEIRELVEAGVMSPQAIKQYIFDQGLQLQNKVSVSAEELMEQLRRAYETPSRWIVKKDGRSTRRMHVNLLHANRRLCLFLLEESDFMSDLNEAEQNALRTELSVMCDKCNDFIDASDLLSRGEEEAEAYVESIFAKLQKTGYLYQASKVFRKLIAIFLLDPKMMSGKMIELVDILAIGNSKTWCKPTIRPYIVSLLDFYIGELGKRIDRMAGFNNQSDSQILETAIKTLCIELYLYDNDDICFEKRQSMLYRYASYYKPSQSGILLSKAFTSLTGGFLDHNIEYPWDKINSVSEVVLLLAFEKQSQGTCLKYDGSKASVIIENGDITVLPLNADKTRLTKTIPAGLLPWHNFQIMVSDAPGKHPNASTTDISTLKKWWTEIERELFQGKVKKSVKIDRDKKRKPFPEETVEIVIDGISSYIDGVFNCHVVSDKIEAAGTISISDIVSYRIRPEDFSLIMSKAFHDSETGLPYKFEAEAIIDEKTDLYRFKMKNLIEDFLIREVDYIGQLADAVVTGQLPYTKQYTCVSQDGVTVLIPLSDGDFKPGDYIAVDITDADKDRKVGLQYIGKYAGPALNSVSQQEGFVYLLNYYAKGTYDPREEQKKEIESKKNDVFKPIGNHIIIELMQLLDCEGNSQDDVHKRYNYLELSRILAMTLDDKAQESYYENRLSLQMMLQDFSKSSKINYSKLQELEKLDDKTMAKYPMLKLRIDELHVLDCLGKPSETPVLYEMQSKATNKELKKLLTLAVAYNNLDTLGMQEECDKVAQQINTLLRIKYDIKPSVYIGVETELIEFKTSLVYYANAEHKVIPDPQEQMKVILKEVCSFLNSKGGKLYIGVNDQGYVSDIIDDIDWFKNHPIFKVSSLDEYQRYLTNAILNKWKGIGPLVSVMLKEENDRNYLEVTISPSRKPIELDGTYFIRVATSCRSVAKESLTSFLQRRPLQYDQMMGVTKS